MSQRINLVILLILLATLANTTLVRAEYCQWTYVQPGLYCSTELKNIDWQEKDKTFCSNKAVNNQTEKCCCIPQKPKEEIKISPKYIIIGSLFIIFGIITAYFLVVKNNEEN